MEKGEIWIVTSTLAEGLHIKKVLEEANLLNPVSVLDFQQLDPDACFSKHRLPSLLLVDLDLPGETAWQLLAAARNAVMEKEIRLVALVAGKSEALLDRAYEAGVHTYLRKPLSFQQLLQRARILNLCFELGRRPHADPGKAPD